MSDLQQKLILGSRGSKLALWQAERAKKFILEKNRNLDIEIKIVKTKGDIIADTALSKIGDEGLFTKAIEDELLAGTIDVGVHSCKDLPTNLAEGLRIAAYPEREDIRDAMISNSGKKLKYLKDGSVIGTSSLRRRAFLKRLRKDLQFVDLRGNIDTRLRKLKEGGMDAIIMAYAAAIRMNISDSVTEIFESEMFPPAVGQGAIALEMRAGDRKEEFVSVIDNPRVRPCVEAERSLLRTLRGGCQVPVGCWSRCDSDGGIFLTAAIADYQGKRYIKEGIFGKISPGEAEEVGEKLANELLDKGGEEIMDEIRSMK